MNSIRIALTLVLLSALLPMAARPAQAQTETALYNFTGGSDGSAPYGPLTPDGKGNFYGTTSGGGAFGGGTVFELSPNGSGGWNESTLYSFCSVAPNCADGANSTVYGSYVTFDSLGNLYGTTWAGGAYGYGVVFKLSPVGTSWEETVLYNYDGGAGYGVVAGVIFDPEGNLYGTTYGAIFELSPSGGGWTEQTIFNEGYGGGWAGLIMDVHGNIFGVGSGSVFELSPNGSGGWNSTVIHSFAGA